MMKKKFHLLFAALVFTLVLAVGVTPTFAEETYAQEDAEETEAPEVYRVTIKFNSNGGSGIMDNITIESGQPATLPANTFKRDGFVFAGWSTDKKGEETVYQDKGDVSELADADNNGREITLYAQWKLAAPKIKSIKSPSPADIKITFGKCKGVSGYEVAYSTSNKFSASKTYTVNVDKSLTSARLLEVTPNKKYYVRMRSYQLVSKKKQYGEWSKTVSVKVKNGKTMANTKGDTCVEADIKLNGKGTGYHAKLVMGNVNSAVSFGLQYDAGAQEPYTGKTMALVENIASNYAGGQTYTRLGNPLRRNKTYHVMMISNGKNKIDCYVDYKKIGSTTSDVAATSTFVRIEACARLTGDSVDAEFSNIKYKIARNSTVRVLGKDLKWKEKRLNKGLKYKYDKKNNVIRLYGTEKNVHGDWDSDYEGVSEILQFEY